MFLPRRCWLIFSRSQRQVLFLRLRSLTLFFRVPRGVDQSFRRSCSTLGGLRPQDSGTLKVRSCIVRFDGALSRGIQNRRCLGSFRTL